MNNENIRTGIIGENVVSRALIRGGYVILGRNIRYNCGELDFVAMREGKLHFIEVKSARVNHETSEITVNPEENLHFKKILRLKRSIGVYMMINRINMDQAVWQFDLYTVVIHETLRRAEVRIYENVIL